MMFVLIHIYAEILILFIILTFKIDFQSKCSSKPRIRFQNGCLLASRCILNQITMKRQEILQILLRPFNSYLLYLLIIIALPLIELYFLILV